MKGKTIYYVVIKFLALGTGSEKPECQLIVIGLKYQDFLDSEEQKQVLQETVIFCFLCARN